MKSFLKSSIVNRLFAGTIFGLIVLNFFIGVPFYTFLMLGLGWLVLTIIGSFNIQWNYHIDALNFQANCKGRKVALTFDDGPNPVYTPKILELLKIYNAKATFFCIGKQIEAHPEILKKIIDEGHSIGNHTYSHSKYFDFYSPERILEELNKTNRLAEEAVRKKMKLFRPPYGVTNPSVKKALMMSKHTTIGWNIRSLDTVLKSKDRVVRRVTRRLKSGDIILLHDRIPQTAAALEEVLTYLQKNDFEAVSVDQLLNINAYEFNH